jgi:hypothetical protein
MFRLIAIILLLIPSATTVVIPREQLLTTSLNAPSFIVDKDKQKVWRGGGSELTGNALNRKDEHRNPSRDQKRCAERSSHL